jgi:hypothetical protein
MGDRGSIPGLVRDFLFSSQRPDLFWGPANLFPSGY